MSSYTFNNDLVGKGKPWGPCADLDKLHLTIYKRYHAMCDRCDSSPTYVARGIKNHFVSLSQFYNALRKQKHGSVTLVRNGKTITIQRFSWDEFKKNPSLYHIDKDCSDKTWYDPDTIMIILAGDNIKEKNARVGVSYLYSAESESRRSETLSRAVVGIDPQGVYHEWASGRETASDLNATECVITQTCNGCRGSNGKNVPHTKSRGKLKGWTFYWKDEYKGCL